MDLGIEYKVALVTGASRGLGRHAALSLAKEGVHVAICGRTEETIEKTVQELQVFGTKVVGIIADITDAESIKPLLGKINAALGPIDILVNNVGGSRGRHPLETTEEQYREAFDLNLFGALRLIQATVPHMQERQWGRVINIASIYGRESKGSMTYNASKLALISFTKSLAKETARDGIRVNSICPGGIIFPGGAWERRIAEAPDGLKGYLDTDFPLGRFGRPEEVSVVAVLMASPRASLVHGASWVVDGSQSRSNI